LTHAAAECRTAGWTDTEHGVLMPLLRHAAQAAVALASALDEAAGAMEQRGGDVAH
jgi:hypothetical protein